MQRMIWPGHATALLTLWQLCGAPTTVDAAPTLTRGARVRVPPAPSRVTRVDNSKPADRTRRRAVTAEQFRTRRTAAVARLTERAIATLERLIAVTDDSDPDKPDYLFRLAEHFRDTKLQFMFRARALDQAIWQAHSAARRVRLEARQKRYERAEQQWLRRAMKLYLRIATTSPFAAYRRMDQVLFNVADMLNQAGRRDRARVFFRRLIRDHPQSAYIPDAYLSFAEFYFNEGRVDSALKLYQQVSKHPGSPLHGYALYKQGWCWLNLKRPRRALEQFVRVIREAGNRGGSARGRIVLVREARKDAVRAYSHVGAPDKAWVFFQRIGGGDASAMLERLARIYAQQGKFAQATRTYRQLIALKPGSDRVCAWQYAVVKATLAARSKRQQMVEARRLAALYRQLRQRRGRGTAALTTCRGNAAGVLRELATTWHREAQQTQERATLQLAGDLYRVYLQTFPHHKGAYTLAYYHAELLYTLERWDEAAAAYARVVKMKPRGRYLAAAAYAAVAALEQAHDARQGQRGAAEPRQAAAGGADAAHGAKPTPLSASARKRIAAMTTYVELVAEAPERVAVMYRLARIYYEHNRLDRAVRIFARIVTRNPKHALAPYAANLLLDSLNLLGRHEELRRWAVRMLKSPELAHGEIGRQLRALRWAAERKLAEALQRKGRFKACGETYARIANGYPEDPNWSAVVHNAAICFEAAKLIGQAIAIRRTLIKVKPDDPLARRAMLMIGQNYHALAWYSRAAEYYERFARLYPGEQKAPEALQNAIVFRMGRGEHDRATDDARLFAKNYGGREAYAARTAAVIFALGAIFDGPAHRDALVKHYTAYLARWGKQGGLDRRVRAHVKVGTVLWQASCPVAGVNGACVKVQRVRSRRKLARHTRRRGSGKRGRRTQCGPATKMKVTVVKRDRTRARAAQRHFARAMALFEGAAASWRRRAKGKELAQRAARLRYAVAQARFYQAEARFEDFLAVSWSGRSFRDYLTTKSKRLEQARKLYAEVILQRQAHWALAASARVGQLFQNFADGLYTAPVPRAPVPRALTGRRDREAFVELFTDRYCDELEQKATKLEDKAVQGLAACLGKSTELSWYNEWSRLCERELNQIKPAEYPEAAEIRAEPGYVTYRTDRAGVITHVRPGGSS